MLVIEKQKVNALVAELAKNNIVVIPHCRKDGECVFEKFEMGMEIDLDYTYTILPAKQFFLPATDNTFVFEKKRGEVSVPEKEEKFILFGLNLRDLEAITQLDEIMQKPIEDFFYFQKRNRATIIGLTNETTKNFPGGDLILERINNEQYQVIAITDKGRDLAKNKLFKEEAALITGSGSKIEKTETMPHLRHILLDTEFLADAVSWSWKNMPELWEELGKSCVGCGICTYVCPLCYCFSIEDEISLDGNKCKRCRKWDACTLPGFARISGGYNFHKTIKERYYNWFYHKFVRAYKEYGKSQCIACGRCQKYCPAKIDIEKILIKITENYAKSLPAAKS